MNLSILLISLVLFINIEARSHSQSNVVLFAAIDADSDSDCDESYQTTCPGGCCPEANWFCCADGQYCAAQEWDCPYIEELQESGAVFDIAGDEAESGVIHGFAALHENVDADDCDESYQTTCPGGCCPEANWFCCADNEYCAAQQWDCPYDVKVRDEDVTPVSEPVVTSAKDEAGSNLFAALNGNVDADSDSDCGVGQTTCPGGCCPEANWFCCADGQYCAAQEWHCPSVVKKMVRDKDVTVVGEPVATDAKDESELVVVHGLSQLHHSTTGWSALFVLALALAISAVVMYLNRNSLLQTFKNKTFAAEYTPLVDAVEV